MKKLIKLYDKYGEIIRYLIVGGLTTALNLAVYYLCVFTFLDPKIDIELQIANILAWIAGVVFAYLTNRKYVFKSGNANVKKEAAKFLGARIATLLLDMLTMHISVSILKMNDKIMKIISNILVIIANYVFSKMLVFRNYEA